MAAIAPHEATDRDRLDTARRVEGQLRAIIAAKDAEISRLEDVVRGEEAFHHHIRSVVEPLGTVGMSDADLYATAEAARGARPAAAPPPPAVSNTVRLLTEIRDVLRARR